MVVTTVSKRKIDKLSKGELEDLKDAVIDDREEENEIEDEYENENEESESSDSEDSDDVDSLGNVYSSKKSEMVQVTDIVQKLHYFLARL